jgi:hypothetical protein
MTSQPYAGFDPDGLQDYVFVPLPALRKHYILRHMTVFDEDEDEDESESESESDEDEDEDEGKSEDEDEGENQDGERGGRGVGSGDEQEEGEGEEGGDEQDVVDIEDGNAIVHITPFSQFPLLEHHAHPFFVIHNALPKLQEHQLLLCPEHNALLILMNKIKAIWMSRLSRARKRRRPSDESPDDDDDDDDRPKRKTRGAAKRHKSELPGADEAKTRETRRADVGKGKGKARGLGKTMPAQPQKSHLLPSPTFTVKSLRPEVFLFDDVSEVAAWAAAVAAAGPPEDTDQTVIWSDEEPVRAPIRKWDRWHVPYKQPKQWARFCSSDWPMYFYSFPLWMPSYD